MQTVYAGGAGGVGGWSFADLARKAVVRQAETLPAVMRHVEAGPPIRLEVVDGE